MTIFFERNTVTIANLRRGRTIATIVAGAVLAVTIGPASADPPTWTPADPDLAGGITLYDASGAEVTSGSLSDGQIAAFAVGDTVLPGNGTRATLYAYTPVAGNDGKPLLPGEWTGLQLTANTAAPTSLPAGIPAGKPVVPISAGATTLGQYVAGYPSSVTKAGYVGVYELRLRTDGPGSSSVAYDAVDVVVTGDSWAIAGSDAATPTTTTLAVTPAGASAGSPLTLTASVSPSAAGKVQFRDGATAVGAPVTVTSGSATSTTAAVAGTHSYTAVFTPTDPTAFSPSTSAPTSYTVTGGATATTTDLTATPTAPKAGGTVALRAAVSPTAAGTVQFRDGSAALGAPVAVASGVATTSAKVTKAGAHTYTAVFTPSNAGAFSGSSDSLKVTAAKATAKVKVTVPPKVKATQKATLTVAVTATGLVATGKVTIYDGAKKLGVVTLKSGKASYKLPALKKGKHTIKVSYAGDANVGAKSVSTTVTSS